MLMNKIFNEIKNSNKIGISFHVSPDGDSIGSAIALTLGLRALNKECYIISKESLPNTFSYLACAEEIDGEHFNVKEDTDLVIVLDCGDFKRINAELVREKSGRRYTLVNIDHHMSNEEYADYNYVDTNAASVGEIVYQMLQLLNVKVDKKMAEAIYTSLLTDTGSFRHSNTTSVTHTIAGDLINTGINFSNIHRIIFDNKDFKRVKLYGKVIDSIELYHDGKIAVMYLTQSMLDELNIIECDSSDIIGFGSMIESVEVTVFLKESDGKIKVSLRSKEQVDVRKVAEEFNGGGHVRAAGLAFEESTIDEAKQILLERIEKELR